MVIVLKDLPKISLNKWYAGAHWSKRKRIKDAYHQIIRLQTNELFSKDYRYSVKYDFKFKSRPIDASNCIAMVKMIEDVLFEDDKWDVVQYITVSSRQGDLDLVTIDVTII